MKMLKNKLISDKKLDDENSNIEEIMTIHSYSNTTAPQKIFNFDSLKGTNDKKSQIIKIP